MAALIDIVNMALQECGSEPVTLSDYNADTYERGRAAKQAWDFVRKTVYRLHPWNPPEKYAQLDADATAPLWGFSTRYALPADFVRMLEVDTTEPWHISGLWIYTDQTGDDLGIRYIFDETTYSNLDSTIVDTLVLYLACRIAKRITDDKALVGQLLARWDDFLKRAQSVDGQEQSDAEFEDDTWVQDRW